MSDEVVCPNDQTILTPLAKDPYLGTLLAGRYEILEIIGGGGMGLVYKARHTMMNRVVAIKMLHQHLTNSTDALKRFKLEAEAASCLSLPNILTIYDFGVSDEGQPYMVMDYLEGTSLADVLEADGRLPVVRALNIFIQACAGLAHAHQKGVIHRDLKPSNIMLVNYADDQSDFVKIVDFGIAKLLNRADGSSANLTRTGEVYGSPLYMSPEQCRGQDLDARSDLYAFGCVMYKTLTGLPVFTGSEMIELLFKQVSELPKSFAQAIPDSDVPSELEKIVFKCLQKDPDRRYDSMNELKDVLEAFKRKVEGRDTTDTGDYPVTDAAVFNVAPASQGQSASSSWSVQRGPGLVPGPLASAMAQRAQDAHQVPQGAAAAPAARAASGAQAATVSSATEMKTPGTDKQPQSQTSTAAATTSSSQQAELSNDVKMPQFAPTNGGNGGTKAAEDLANILRTTGQQPRPDDNGSAGGAESRGRAIAEMSKPSKAIDNHRSKANSDWFMMLEGVFSNRSIVVASIIVIILGITVVALYFSHRNNEAPTAAHDVVTAPPGEKSDESKTTSTNSSTDSEQSDSKGAEPTNDEKVANPPSISTDTTTSTTTDNSPGRETGSNGESSDSKTSKLPIDSKAGNKPGEDSVTNDTIGGAAESKAPAQNSAKGRPSPTPPNTFRVNDSVKPNHKSSHPHHNTQSAPPASHNTSGGAGHRHAYSSYEF